MFSKVFVNLFMGRGGQQGISGAGSFLVSCPFQGRGLGCPFGQSIQGYVPPSEPQKRAVLIILECFLVAIVITIEEIANVYIIVIAKLIAGVNGSLAPSGHSLHFICRILCSLNVSGGCTFFFSSSKDNTIFQWVFLYSLRHTQNPLRFEQY